MAVHSDGHLDGIHLLRPFQSLFHLPLAIPQDG
jgi:hypothetical protein